MMSIEEQKAAILKIRAFDGTSFDPEKRIAHFADEYTSIWLHCQKVANDYNLTQEQKEKISDRLYKLATDYLYAESRCLSWAITGPARFPVARNEKRVNSAQAKINLYVNFYENIEKLCKRWTHQEETQDDKKARWLKRIDFLEKYQEMMKDVNKMIRQGKKEEAEKKYNITLEKNCWGDYGFEGYHLSNNLATIKRLKQQVADLDRARETKADDGFSFAGGSVAFDGDEIRWNISFDSIPEADMRTKLKSHGFKWSPRRQAWTRGAKTMSIKTIKEILGVLK